MARIGRWAIVTGAAVVGYFVVGMPATWLFHARVGDDPSSTSSLLWWLAAVVGFLLFGAVGLLVVRHEPSRTTR